MSKRFTPQEQARLKRELETLHAGLEQRTELQRASRSVWQALSDAEYYLGALDSLEGGQAVARKIRMDLERAFDWVSELMHPDDIDD